MHRPHANAQVKAFCLLTWVAVLALAWLAYHPGLSGGFLFDDFVNLPALGDTGPIDDAGTFWRYLTSGTADPTGRPLSLLSFLIDARNWPADPAPFLRTNLVLHLANGTLLFFLLASLGRWISDDDGRNRSAALLGAALWLLHPLFVSTTLYVVQREAMLPATFVLGGLLAYSRGRAQFQTRNGKSGLGWMLAGVVIGTVLATLSKANGLLLPLLALVLESTVFANERPGEIDPAAEARLRLFKRVVLVLPSLLLAAYLASFLASWNEVPGGRPWTIGQRALTEPRVLLDYVQLLVVPRSVSTGLYNDDYPAAASLWHPGSTLPILFLFAGIAAMALAWRRKWPVASAATLFFLAGHALESTVVPLELYFEHRNYLPAMLFFWPLSRAVVYSRRPALLRIAVSVMMIGLVTVTTYQRAAIWGNPQQLAALWASKNPQSSRAQATAAQAELESGRADVAASRLRPLWMHSPADLQIALNYVSAACASGGISGRDAAMLRTTFETGAVGTPLVRQWLEQALDSAIAGPCPGISLDVVEALVDAAMRNPLVSGSAREKSLVALKAMIALEEKQPDRALGLFNRALLANPLPETAAGQAAILASHGYYRQALAHLDAYERQAPVAPRHFDGMPYLHSLVLERQRYWPREIELLRSKLNAEIAREDP